MKKLINHLSNEKGIILPYLFFMILFLFLILTMVISLGMQSLESVATEKETKQIYYGAEAGLETVYALVRQYAEQDESEKLQGQALLAFLRPKLVPFQLYKESSKPITVTVKLAVVNRVSGNTIVSYLVITSLARSSDGRGEHELEAKLSLTKPPAGWSSLSYMELRSKYDIVF
ncbi:hypothetical protein F9B85_08255 [Heliorestis acidaminivorans]|uniref:Type 4 fimbrial biogenesis protein PilX N-terminal domain-containing protein n=1 Tax=Heliorestis acidaminivorans TaxID=553427 RepID=A0A6I0F015_9FIRM|nr:hypothetical protein [Heliorestis acidaminivorans]KAB2952641.1 hypothetical protein F9B85_08255 [Heliorestis acidaminivorans]